MNTKKIKLLGLLLVTFFATSCANIIPMMAPSVDHEENISPDFNYKSQFMSINGEKIHYVDEGQGDVVILVHGNPTSSYLWRNIIPTLSKTHRVIALDLIGMGKSSKPDIAYTLQDHTKYFRSFVKRLKVENVTLVLHDWGGGIGLDYARKNPQNVKRIVMIEAVTNPITWDDADMVSTYMFKMFRDQEDGDELLIEDNYFVEKMLPMMIGRKLSKKEHDYYKKPYLKKSARKPVRVWPQEIPIEGTPKRNLSDIGKNYKYLKTSSVPIMFIHGDPGIIYTEDTIKKFKKEIPRAKFFFIGEGLHYIQETKPRKISKAISKFIN